MLAASQEPARGRTTARSTHRKRSPVSHEGHACVWRLWVAGRWWAKGFFSHAPAQRHLGRSAVQAVGLSALRFTELSNRQPAIALGVAMALARCWPSAWATAAGASRPPDHAPYQAPRPWGLRVHTVTFRRVSAEGNACHCSVGFLASPHHPNPIQPVKPKACSADATVPWCPAASAAAQPGREPQERTHRGRELLHLVVRDAMVRASVPSSSYKFKVLSRPARPPVPGMIDLAREYGGDTARAWRKSRR